jgi:hypothetical protein
MSQAGHFVACLLILKFGTYLVLRISDYNFGAVIKDYSTFTHFHHINLLLILSAT